MKNKIHYLFLCLCLACTAPFLTSCSDDDDSNKGKTGEVGDLVGRWVSTTLEEWEQKPGSNTRDDYAKEIFTTTLTLKADGTGSLVEADSDRRDFEWSYDSETGVLILDETNNYEVEGPITVRISWQNGSKFTWLESEFDEYDNTYWYTQYIFTRTK